MTRGSARRRSLPLLPLLAQYLSAPGSGLSGTLRVPALDIKELDTSPDEILASGLEQFAASVLPVNYHPNVFRTRIRFLRHALTHLLRGQDPIPERLSRCITPGEAYHVSGIGWGFWAAVATSLDPETIPLWCPAVERGLRVLGMFPENPRGVAERFAAVMEGCSRIRKAATGLTTTQTVDFLERVSRMNGRELPMSAAGVEAFAWSVGPEEIRQAIRVVRTRLPLRKRIRETAPDLLDSVSRFRISAAVGEYETAFEAFRSAFPESTWEAAIHRLDDAYSATLPDRAQLWCEIATTLRETFRVHPLELADVISIAGQPTEIADRDGFAGFCTDTFQFLGELGRTNTREWMATHRARYQFVLREPLIGLCAAVADRYVRPILNREYGWDLECNARTGRALTSICKNDFGRSGPYQPVQWVTFYRRSQENKRADAQFFVRVASDGVRFGFHLGRSAREAGGQFRKAVQEHGEAVFRALSAGAILNGCHFWIGDDLGTEAAVRSAADLRAWAANKDIAAGVHCVPSDPKLRGDDLPGEVLLTFDRLLPLFACAAELDPRPLLARRAGSPATPLPYDPAAFHQETFLSEVWLDRVLNLLRLKKQLVFQGVPGTGKTHVARCLARLLAHDRPGCIRLVQFHPAYSYEEFVEGIRVRNVEIEGRNEVVYPVEDGVLCEFAEQALLRPSEPHVLVVDELNRGNLPRIFGELLFLLEYRDQAVTLPYSKRPFRLPENLFVLATMNPLDRSAVSLDHAFRRRFSFVEMPADAAILASWLEQHQSAGMADETFGPRVVRLFEELNRRLARDLGPDKQVGHSFFMVSELNPEKLAAIWDHHIRPLLLDFMGGREERLQPYTIERLLNGRTKSQQKPQSDPVNG
jgi:5-methylcytosine-specific restriction protein B